MTAMEVFDIMEKLRIMELELYEAYKNAKLVFGEHSQECGRAISRWSIIYDLIRDLKNQQYN